MLQGYHACCKQLHISVGATRSLLWYHQLWECEIVWSFKKRRFGSLSWDVGTHCWGKIYCRHSALLADASVYPLARPVRHKSVEREHSFPASVKWISSNARPFLDGNLKSLLRKQTKSKEGQKFSLTKSLLPNRLLIKENKHKKVNTTDKTSKQ